MRSLFSRPSYSGMQAGGTQSMLRPMQFERLLPLRGMLLAPSLLILPILLVGCVAVGGTSHAAPQPTAGQELVDLKRAVDCGAISAEEYERMRHQVISGKTASAESSSASH
jgi:hypothetical protein